MPYAMNTGSEITIPTAVGSSKQELPNI